MAGDTKIQELAKVDLHDPVLIQGLPGLGYVGKVAVDYFIEKLHPKKYAELYSGYLLFPDGNLGINIFEDGTYSLPRYEFYAFSEKSPNLVFLTGDAQPSVTGQYEVATTVLDYVLKQNCKTVFTMGGYGTRSQGDVGSVYCVVGSGFLGDQLTKHGAKLAKGGAVTGAAGVILGIGRQRGLDCAGLLGATTGVYPDLEAARAVIHLLVDLLRMPLDLKDLDREVEDMRKKVEKIKRAEVEELKEELGGEGEGKDRYITQHLSKYSGMSHPQYLELLLQAGLLEAEDSCLARRQWMLEASIERGDVRHKASMLLMDNAVLVLFYEEPMRIGTLAFSTPGLREGGATTSSVLLGGKYLIAARALAERAAALFNRMSLVSLNTRLSEGEALRLYSQLLDKVREEGKSVDLSREKLEVKDESRHDGQDRGRQG